MILSWLAGWVWAVVPVDLAKLSDKVERINITIPSRIPCVALMPTQRRLEKAVRASSPERCLLPEPGGADGLSGDDVQVKPGSVPGCAEPL